MKICFVGVGSIAKRHIRNLRKIFPKDLIITALRSGKGKESDTEFSGLIDKIVLRHEELEDSYDAIFITNPTSMHYDTLQDMLPYSDSFFIEKPVFDKVELDVSVFTAINKVFYVACPLRYTNIIRYLKTNIDFSKVYSVRVICSSYLPEWRLDIDYRRTYSAHRNMGGGVDIDLIHEWDYIQYLIGFPKKVECFITKKSSLDIDSDDTAIYIGEYKDKTVELHLDYFGRSNIRRIELISEDDTIVADLIESKVTWLYNGKEMELKEDRDDYQLRELEHFFRITKKEICNDNNVETACKVLKLARGIL